MMIQKDKSSLREITQSKFSVDNSGFWKETALLSFFQMYFFFFYKPHLIPLYTREGRTSPWTISTNLSNLHQSNLDGQTAPKFRGGKYVVSLGRLKGRPGNTSLITSVTVLCSPAEVVQHDVVVAAAEHPALHQAELLPGGQLPLTGETGETGQVVDAAPSPPHPVTGVHLPATLGALSAEPTVMEKETGR